MLSQITNAIGTNNMKRISLDSQGNMFEGNIMLNIKDHKSLNKLFAKLLIIKGIKSVERIDNTEKNNQVDNYKLF